MEVVKYLLKQGADNETCDKCRRTSIYWAIDGSRLNVIKYLIKLSTDIETSDKDGRTPLYWAALKNNGI